MEAGEAIGTADGEGVDTEGGLAVERADSSCRVILGCDLRKPVQYSVCLINLKSSAADSSDGVELEVGAAELRKIKRWFVRCSRPS